MHRYQGLGAEDKAEQNVTVRRDAGSRRPALVWLLVGTNAFWLLVVAGLWAGPQQMSHGYKSDFGAWSGAAATGTVTAG